MSTKPQIDKGPPKPSMGTTPRLIKGDSSSQQQKSKPDGKTTTAPIRKSTTNSKNKALDLQQQQTKPIHKQPITAAPSNNKSVGQLDSIKKLSKDDNKNASIKSQAKKTTTSSSSKKLPNKTNVMTTVHNVTVSSPPSKRKELEEIPVEEEIEPQIKKRDRTKTHTIDPEESILQKFHPENVVQQEPEPPKPSPRSEPIPDPVSFEIKFDSPKKEEEKKENVEKKKENDKEKKENVQEKKVEAKKKKEDAKEKKEDVVDNENNEEEFNYEDDFESYESDFESEVSEDKTPTPEPSSESENEPITKIPFKKEQEREEEQENEQFSLPPFKDRLPLEVIAENLENQDSGFESRNKTETEYQSIEYKSSNFYEPIDILAQNSTSKYSRSRDLMKKISLDTITYSVFELKPIPYEIYMKMYGHMNTSQMSTQTKQDIANEEIQTDSIDLESKWTQNPPHFSKDAFSPKGMTSGRYYEEKIGVGRGESNKEIVEINKRPTDLMEIANKNIDYDRLNLFLRNCSVSIAGIINQKQGQKHKKPQFSESSGFDELNLKHDFLSNHSIQQLASFSNTQNIFALLSKSTNNQHLISIWSALDLKTPQKVLKSSQPVVSIISHGRYPNLIIAGLEDGSICCWDLNETSKWDQDVTRTYQPPNILQTSKENCLYQLVKLCSMDKSKSGKDRAKIACLYDKGLISIWTIIESTNLENGERNIPGAKYKLIYSKSIDLSCHFEPPQKKIKSKFEKTKTYFENDLFNDSALKELQDQEVNDRMKGNYFVCTDLESVDEVLIVGTNQNFILVVPENSYENVKKIQVLNDNKVVSVTKIRAVNSGKQILIGFSDGSVKLRSIGQDYPSEQKVCSDSEDLNEESESDDDNINGKSCAIQNIVLNERKLYDDFQAKQNLDSLEVKGSSPKPGESKEALEEERQNFTEKNLILGSLFSRGFIKELFTDSRRVFILDGDQLKIFHLNKSGFNIEFNDIHKNISDIGLIKRNSNKHSLILIRDQRVEIHHFK